MDHHLEIVKTNIKYPIVFYNHQFNKSRPVSSHYHQDIEVVYVVSGKVEAYIDGKKEIFYQGEMFIINSHSVHQFNFPEFTHLYTYLLSVDVFKEFQIQSYFFKLKAPSNKEWFKPWLEMKYIHHLLPIEQHILMYQLYQKLIQDCLLDKKQEENTKEIYCFNEVGINTKLLDFLSQNHIIIHFFNYYGGYSGTYYPSR